MHTLDIILTVLYLYFTVRYVRHADREWREWIRTGNRHYRIQFYLALTVILLCGIAAGAYGALIFVRKEGP